MYYNTIMSRSVCPPVCLSLVRNELKLKHSPVIQTLVSFNVGFAAKNFVMIRYECSMSLIECSYNDLISVWYVSH